MAIQELVKLFNTKNYDKGFFLQREVVSLRFLLDSGNIPIGRSVPFPLLWNETTPT